MISSSSRWPRLGGKKKNSLAAAAHKPWTDTVLEDRPKRSGISPGLRWSVAGALLGALLALLCFAPAAWLARGLASASAEHLLLTDTRGSIWAGSGVLVLTGGAGSRDASALPGRVEWTMGLRGTSLLLRARQACCLNGELQLQIKPGLGKLEIELPAAGDWLARLPAAWLSGLGTPWNTLQLEGSVRLSARQFKLDWVQGRWAMLGQLDLDFINLSSRVSTLAPLGSYRLSVSADAQNVGQTRLMLSTLDGALILSGQGTAGGAARARFNGEAQAAPGREAALNNLLNIIGRRQGARSVITIG
ncbi:type II secretion system protein N [Paucibacter sp. APW11]|uniref:Type II secretion system protein N n=1 Tax=Roseateles aquae TaxID=3077235 RepID=A0ABU3PHY4_9BURK|nr:type II secretion system protein N [Paucibacter sp. APW11]MDT9002175.1 type II secretion system protein N [Paucibacter sp. APW11]